MEQLRQAILKLESNFKDVINCHSKNLESLKNYTVELNERGGALEKTAKCNKVKATDLIVVKNDLTNLEGKIDCIEDKLAEHSKSTTDKQNQDREMLQELLEDNDHKITEVDENLQQYKKTMKKQEKKFVCDECGENCVKKIDLREAFTRKKQK